jgi:hypothetical protein
MEFPLPLTPVILQVSSFIERVLTLIQTAVREILVATAQAVLPTLSSLTSLTLPMDLIPRVRTLQAHLVTMKL